jgi:hypothetical protein
MDVHLITLSYLNKGRHAGRRGLCFLWLVGGAELDGRGRWRLPYRSGVVGGAMRPLAMTRPPLLYRHRAVRLCGPGGGGVATGKGPLATLSARGAGAGGGGERGRESPCTAVAVQFAARPPASTFARQGVRATQQSVSSPMPPFLLYRLRRAVRLCGAAAGRHERASGERAGVLPPQPAQVWSRILASFPNPGLALGLGERLALALGWGGPHFAAPRTLRWL